MQTISPFLWFDDQAEEAAAHYVSIFPNSKILHVSRYGEGGSRPAGTAMSVTFVLDGLELQALNGGPGFRFTEAISFLVAAPTQPEIDDLWGKLTSGGEPGRCGWLKDRYAPFLADRPAGPVRAALRSRSRQVGPRDAGDAGDGQARHRRAACGARRRARRGSGSGVARPRPPAGAAGQPART
jgi:predicted 3-demethylubiquinone-9 3-methyltransferase (glyoxalase superfamily)